ESMVATTSRDANLTGGAEAERITLSVASTSLFDMLGVRPVFGRTFVADEEYPGHARVVVLGHGLWQRRFGGDSALVGKTIALDGESFTVIGIAPSGFQYPWKTDAWITPLRLVPELNPNMDVTQVRGFGYLYATARLKPGVTLEQAQAGMDVITTRLRELHPQTNGNRFNRVVSLQTFLIGNLRAPLLLLLGAVGCVLLIACANVANLLLARNAGRYKEIAIRVAMGASRWRVMRQLLTESLWLALGGGLLGCAVAWWSLDALIALAPSDLPGVTAISMSGSVLAFTFALSVITGALFGLAPAWQVSRSGISGSLGEATRGASVGTRQTRLRSVLIVAEVALSLLLLVGAGLLVRSFSRLQMIDPGFNPSHVLTLRLAPSGAQYPGSEQRASYYDRVIERVAAVPGVDSVGAIDTLPLNRGPQAGFQIDGRPKLPMPQWPGANNRIVTDDYFRVTGIPIVEGRSFGEQDTANGTTVVVVNQTLAHLNFPNESAIGKRISFATNERGESLWFEIIGLIADVRTLDLQKPPEPDFFLLHRQVSLGGMYLAVRTRIEPDELISSVSRAVLEVDRNQPISEVKTLTQIVSGSVSGARFNVWLLGLFSTLSLVMAAAGIYGVMSFTVANRTRELGVRLALGARRGDVLRLVLGQGLKLALVGVVLGGITAGALTKLMESLLFEVSPTDPWTFGAMAMLLTVVSLVACYIPARRATRVDPMVALRCE
ncbi:MAG: ABC transporter permease, partial [Acidobacteriota bacterium]